MGSARRGHGSHSARRVERKRIAEAQAKKLLDLAVLEFRDRKDLAKAHASTAWKMSTRFNIRLRERRKLFCRFCKALIIPPEDARYRLSKKRHGIGITCTKCGKTYRIIFPRLKIGGEP
jgi:RNase P subunit RPR2